MSSERSVLLDAVEFTGRTEEVALPDDARRDANSGEEAAISSVPVLTIRAGEAGWVSMVPIVRVALRVVAAIVRWQRSLVTFG